MGLINADMDDLKYEIEEEARTGARFKVIGVGGGGSNAVARMVQERLDGVEFYAMNTDLQALTACPVPNKLQLGARVTNGLGAGSNPEIGRQAALENTDQIVEVLQGADMVFITAGLGGGTGTGAAPVIAALARELDALVIAVVTKPFGFEGSRRKSLFELALPPSIRELASNPLMLGLLSAELVAGRTPRNEGALLDAYVGQVIDRQTKRNARVDALTGWRVAEDIAWAWLTTGRIGLSLADLRITAAGVARSLQASGFFVADAVSIEQWFLECGLGAIIQGTAIPAHRAVLDHLAGRSVPRHRADVGADKPELREAVARYVGSVAVVDEDVLHAFDVYGSDLEFLARCLHLADRAIAWPRSPEEFATRYISQLRRLRAGPLSGLGVIPPAVRIEIDRGLTWVDETADAAITEDTTSVVGKAARMYLSSPGSSTRFPVTAFRMGGHQGQDIKVRIPQLAAYDRAKAELLHRLDRHLLPDEGPDIVYERLCRYATRAWEVITVSGLTVKGVSLLPWLSRDEVEHLTSRGLVESIREWASLRVGRAVDRADLGGLLVLWVPHPKPLHAVTLNDKPSGDDPYDPGQNRRAFGLHGAPLLLLVDLAERFGIADLPLHPLGLLPESTTDPVLALPSRTYAMDREQASLYLTRHTLAELRSIRYIVDASFSALSARIPAYSTLPRRVTLAMTARDPTWSAGWLIEGFVENNVPADEVRIVEGIPGGWSNAVDDPSIASSFSSSMASYKGVTDATYRELSGDLGALLDGAAALGTQDL